MFGLKNVKENIKTVVYPDSIGVHDKTVSEWRNWKQQTEIKWHPLMPVVKGLFLMAVYICTIKY